MRLILRHPEAAPIQRAKDLCVAVLCEDDATASQACRLLECVGREAGPEGRLIFSCWNFAVLNSPSQWRLAARETAVADLMVVAARAGSELPEAVKDYLGLWLANRDDRSRPRALVALLPAATTHHAATGGMLSELKSLAQSGAVDFFANGDEVGSAPLTRGSVPMPGNSPWHPIGAYGLPGAVGG